MLERMELQEVSLVILDIVNIWPYQTDNNFQLQMSGRGSPIRGLQPNIKEFTLESYALNAENQRLTHLLISKNNQIKTLVETNARIKNTYEAQAKAYRKTIESLEKQLHDNENTREEEFQMIKHKYDRLNQDELSTLKNSHTNEIQFLFKEIAQLRASIQTYNAKLQVKDHELLTLKQSYQRQLSSNTTEINTLNKKLIQIQQDKLKQIKDLTNKRQLQRSRTSGIVNSRKQSNQYIQKQLRKLNEDILEKTINIENMNRELNKQKRKHEETTKGLNKRIEAISQDYENQLKEKDQHFAKIQKILKDQILEYKEKEIRLLNQNQSLTSSINILRKEIQNKDAVVKAKTDEVYNFKAIVQKMREEHINEINNLMKERKKRSSKSNLGSSRSLGSSMKDSANITPAANNSPQHQNFPNKLAGFLPTVKEEGSPSPQHKDLSRDLSHSNILEEQHEDELARAIFHYDTIIDELKRSHEMELDYYKSALDKESGKLKEKQSQLEDVLTRFSPLVKIHAEEKSLEEDRKERIERHWKADVGILEIMLKKYRILTF